jgi:hypothetical protein
MIFRTNAQPGASGPKEPTGCRPTFEELAALEPRLNHLLAEARSYHEKKYRRFCANAVWYGYPGHEPGLKQGLSELVGWESGQKGLLGSREAYDVAYQTLYQALPNCRHRIGVCRSFLSTGPRKGSKQEGEKVMYSVRASDIPRKAIPGTADPETPIPVSVTGEGSTTEITPPLREIMPQASRNWKGNQGATPPSPLEMSGPTQ